MIKEEKMKETEMNLSLQLNTSHSAPGLNLNLKRIGNNDEKLVVTNQMLVKISDCMPIEYVMMLF